MSEFWNKRNSCRVLRPDSGPGPESLPTIFIDRDGVLIREKDYLADPSQVELLPGIAQALISARDEGFQLIGISNQSGIGRGLFSETAFREVMNRLEILLSDEGASLDGFYYCPHEPKAKCSCRKPALGLLDEAAEDYNWDPERSWMIGDKVCDVGFGRNAGLGAFLVLTGHGVEHSAELDLRFKDDSRVRIVADLPSAISIILNETPGSNQT